MPRRPRRRVSRDGGVAVAASKSVLLLRQVDVEIGPLLHDEEDHDAVAEEDSGAPDERDQSKGFAPTGKPKEEHHGGGEQAQDVGCVHKCPGYHEAPPPRRRNSFIHISISCAYVLVAAAWTKKKVAGTSYIHTVFMGLNIRCPAKGRFTRAVFSGQYESRHKELLTNVKPGSQSILLKRLNMLYIRLFELKKKKKSIHTVGEESRDFDLVEVLIELKRDSKESF